MARMSIDDMFLREPRVAALARAIGWNKYEARGRLLEVFAVAYDRVDSGGEPILTSLEIDLAADFEGLSKMMLEHNLAAETRFGLRIKGTEERTKYLSTRESSGRAGGIKSGEARRNKSKVTAKVEIQETKVTFAKTEGPLNPSPDLDPSVDPDLEKKREPIVSVEVAQRVLEYLGAKNGVSYRSSKTHVGLILGRLKDGVTEDELKAIVDRQDRKWPRGDTMREYLRPETLFGPTSISKYLDPARSEAAKRTPTSVGREPLALPLPDPEEQAVSP